METVEYLVVRKEAQTEVGIGESLVQSVVNGSERDVVSNGESLRIGRFLMAGVAYGTQFVALENLLQSACLLLAVRKNVETIALKQEVFESLSQQFEVLMKQRLRRNVECDGGLGSAGRMCSHLDEAETADSFAKFYAADQIVLLTHFAHNLLLLHLRGALKTFRKGLLGEAVVINLLNGRAEIEAVLEDQQGVLGQHGSEGLLVCGGLCQFRNNLNRLLRVLRELVCHLERADGVHLVAEEVDAEGQFGRVRIDVDDASAHRKLSRFVNIVDLLEAKIAHLSSEVSEVYDVAYADAYGALVEVSLRHHKLAESFRTAYHIEEARIVLPFASRMSCREA